MAHPRLIGAPKYGNGADIASEWLEPPLFRVEIIERNAAVVLKNRCAVVEKEAAHLREAAAMQEIGRALDEAVGDAELVAERQEATPLHAVVGEVGAEIVKRLAGVIAV